jgi:beta-N-acetylhexosaminidase
MRMSDLSNRKRWITGSVAVVAAPVVFMAVHTSGSSSATKTASIRPIAGPAAQAAPQLTAAQQSAVAVMASKLTARQLAGQRVIYSYTGRVPPASLLQRIRTGEAAGVIFFSDNIASEAQIHAVVKQMEAAAKQSPVPEPLLLMTDQEGGEVRRLPGAPVLSEKQIGASSHRLTLARQAGTGAGDNLRGVGMNVNLAPVVDVYRHAGDFTDKYHRSYSANPATVGTLDHAFIYAQQHVGVAATAKHFPGLGAATAGQNTDEAPVTIKVPLATLRKVDEAPYTKAIAIGTKLVMVSWATYPALDPSRPAGLSSKVVQGELRGRLGYRGVTITDALDAGGLRGYGSSGHRAVLAAGAGMDLLLSSTRTVTGADNAATGLSTAYQQGTLGKAAFMAAVERLIALRETLH